MKRSLFFAAILVLATTSLSAQKMKILSGDPNDFKEEGGYHVTFVSPLLVIGKFPSEEAFVTYFRDQANAIKPDSGTVWAEEWESAWNGLYKPKFIELFNKYSAHGLGYVVESDQKYALEVDVRYINPGGQMVNGRKSPARLEFQITLRSRHEENISPLVISMTKVKGIETVMPHDPMSDVQRISEGFAKCGKEVAQFLAK